MSPEAARFRSSNKEEVFVMCSFRYCRREVAAVAVPLMLMIPASANRALGQTIDTLRLVPVQVTGKAAAVWRVQRVEPDRSLTKEQRQPASLDVRDVPFAEAVIVLQRMTTGVHFVIQKEVGSVYAPVSLRFTGRPLDVVVHALARAAGAAVEWKDGTYLFRPLPSTPNAAPLQAPPVPSLPAPTTPPPAISGSLRDLLYRGERVEMYHPLYVEGLAPGQRVRGAYPPPVLARPQLVVPEAVGSRDRDASGNKPPFLIKRSNKIHLEGEMKP